MRKMLNRSVFTALLFGVVTNTAVAQNVDLAQQSFPNLAIPANVDMTMPPEAKRAFFEEEAFDLFGWDRQNSPPRSPETAEWCMQATAEMQIILGETKANGEARIDANAIQKRCSQVYSYNLRAQHACAIKTNEKDGKRYAECVVESTILWRHWVPRFPNGNVVFERDDRWQGNGSVEITDRSVMLQSINERVTPQEAKRMATIAASRAAGTSLIRKMKDIPEFRERAPIVNVSGAYADTCLGDKSVYLDKPFLVVKPTEDGVETVGFVKARDIGWGCTETPQLRERANAEGVELSDYLYGTSSQMILGNMNIQVGMTADELPSMGASMGLGFAAGGAYLFELGIAYELSLARRTGISELHSAGSLGIQGGFVGIDVGILKRKYIRRFFFDGGLGITALYDAESSQAAGFGAWVDAGGGVQLSPRMLLRLRAGFKAGSDPYGGGAAPLMGLYSTYLL